MAEGFPFPPDIVTRQATESPNVVNDSTAPRTLAIVGALTGFSALIVILRVYVRAFVLKHFGTDDYIIVFALACALGVLACFVAESQHGLGRYNQFIEDWVMLAKWTYCHAIIIVAGISAVKISLGFFLFRFAARTRFRWFIIGAIVFLIAFTIACLGTLIFQCVPVEAVWNYRLRAHANCFSGKTYTDIGLFNSIINIITDFVFATMPVPMFYNVQVNKRTKASLMFILSLGYFACAAAIVKAVFQVQVFEDPSPYRNDYLLWNDIELNLGILAASLPTLKPIFKSVIGSTRNLTSGRKNTTNGYYIRQGSAYALQSLHSHSRGPGTTKSQKYDVQVSAARRSLPGSMDSEEALYSSPARERGYESPQGDAAIMRTTEVIVERDNRSRHGEAPRFGRRGPDNWI